MASKVFRFRNQFPTAFTPGTSTAGRKGPVGDKGPHGPRIYFIECDPDNSAYKDSILEKIRGNVMASDEHGCGLNSIGYVDGDIFIAPNGSVYRYESDDLKYVGDVTDNSASATNTIEYVSIQSTSAVNRMSTPTNRAYGHVSKQPQEQDIESTFVEATATIVGVTNSERFEYTLLCMLKNDLSVTGDGLTNSRKPFPQQLEKTSSIYKTIRFTFPQDAPMSIKVGDMSADKLHPSDNEIGCTMIKENGINSFYTSDGTNEYKSTAAITDSALNEVGYLKSINGVNTPMDQNIFLSNLNPEERNYRGGDSAFFSSYKNDQKRYEEMKKFLFGSMQNEYYIEIRDKSTNEIYIVRTEIKLQ